MAIFYVYSTASGLFTGTVLSVPRGSLAANLGSECAAIEVGVEGDIDPLSQRVDLVSGALTDYVPPQPSERHVWNAETKRWVLSADAVARRAQHERSLRLLQAGDLRALRAIRELTIDPDNQAARERLVSIELGCIEARKGLLPKE